METQVLFAGFTQCSPNSGTAASKFGQIQEHQLGKESSHELLDKAATENGNRTTAAKQQQETSDENCDVINGSGINKERREETNYPTSPVNDKQASRKASHPAPCTKPRRPNLPSFKKKGGRGGTTYQPINTVKRDKRNGAAITSATAKVKRRTGMSRRGEGVNGVYGCLSYIGEGRVVRSSKRQFWDVTRPSSPFGSCLEEKGG